MSAPPRFKLTVAYDGWAFHGWQEQNPPAAPPLRTVQRTLRQAIEQTVHQPVELVGASRTDARVHALGQVAAFSAQTAIPPDRLAQAINSRLPDDLEIRHLEPVGHDFDPIAQARSKQYRYRIHNSSARPLFTRRHVWHCWYRLDLDAMADAAARLVGRHDFAAFANARHGRLSTVRTIHHCRIEKPDPDPEVHLVVAGDGFLYHMVRIIAGTLVEIGRGHWPPQRIDRLFEQPDLALAGPTLPPHGLCLEWIRY